MKADQDRVRMLITQTITMLCKKGLEFETELRVQGLLGVTVDNKDIFLIHLNEKYDNVSDTKDALPRQESVATSTGNERSQFSPQGISPDNGTACETAFHLNADIFGVKAESDQIPLLQPNFDDLQESMNDHFPYGECHTTGSALLASAEYSEPGFLMETEPAFSVSANLPPALRDTRADYKTSCGSSGGRSRPEAGTILLDSGDERDDDFRPQSMRQLTFNVSETDSRSHTQINPENKIALQSAYAPQAFRSSDEPNFELEQSAEGSSQSWNLHPVSRSQFSAQSPSRVAPQRQQMPFNPELVGKFTMGSNRPPAMMQSTYHARGVPVRRSSGRQPIPVTPGRGGVLGSMKPTMSNEEIGIRYSQSPTSPGSSMLWSPSMTSSTHSPGMSLPPARGFPPVRRSYRARGPRVSGRISRGSVAAVGAGRMLEEFGPGVGASPRGQPGVAGMTRAARGVTRVKTRCVDGYSYGKQTVTNYVCNICSAVYKNHSSLLTHQVKVHGRQKKEGKGRPRVQMTYDEGNEDEDTETEEMGEMM